MKRIVSIFILFNLALLSLSNNRLHADDAGRTLGFTAGGAALGGAFGGGRGAAIGAGTGLLVGLATSKGDNKKSRRPSRRKLEQDLRNVNREIDRINAEITAIENGTKTATQAEIDRLKRGYLRLKKRREDLEDQIDDRY